MRTASAGLLIVLPGNTGSTMCSSVLCVPIYSTGWAGSKSSRRLFSISARVRGISLMLFGTATRRLWPWRSTGRGRCWRAGAGGVNKVHCLGADARALPFREACFDLVVSALLLQWIDDLPSALAEIRRVLRPRAAFLFATLGPDTLVELRRLFARVDTAEHVLSFPDMHVVGDLLVEAGFSEPVLDVSHIEILYPDLRALLGGLRGLGATNHRRDRPRALGGRDYWKKLEAASEAERRPGEGLPATFEVIYGLAWAPAVRWRETGS